MDGGTAIFQLASTANFNLDSVDKYSDGGSGTARFTAFLDGNNLGFVDVSDAGTFNFGSLFDNIDEFRVTVIDSHFTYDNLNFSPAEASVPEPATLTIWSLLAGVGAIVGWRRRKRTA